MKLAKMNGSHYETCQNPRITMTLVIRTDLLLKRSDLTMKFVLQLPIYCAPFKKLELAFRNQLAQTNGVLFRRPRSTSENRIALTNRTIEGDLLMVR